MKIQITLDLTVEDTCNPNDLVQHIIDLLDEETFFVGYVDQVNSIDDGQWKLSDNQ